MASALLIWQHCGLSLASPVSQMRKLRPVNLEWLPRSRRESRSLLTPHSDLPLTVTPGGAVSRLAEGVGLGQTREPVKKLHQDVVLPPCTQPCAGASGAAKGPPSPPSRSRCWRQTLSQGAVRGDMGRD